MLLLHYKVNSEPPFVRTSNETEAVALTRLATTARASLSSSIPSTSSSFETTTAALHNQNSYQNRNSNRIVFGTAALSQAEHPFELLDAAYQQGFHRFDLARTYGGGASERIFGAWLRDRSGSSPSKSFDRSSVHIITKGGMGQDKYGNPDRPILTKAALQAEIQASLDALQTDYVDMYMFHRDDPRLDVSQFVVWANELLLAPGNANAPAKSWGVSNWSFERFRQAHQFAVRHNLEPPLANSPQFSLAVPSCEVWPTTQSLSVLTAAERQRQMDWYRRHNVELLCWEVLAKGFMAQPHLWSSDAVDWDMLLNNHDVELGSNEWRLQRLQKAYCSEANYHRRRVAWQLAQQRGCTLSQVATQYILQQSEAVSVIFGSNNLDHLQEMVELLVDKNGDNDDDDDDDYDRTQPLLLDDQAKLLLDRLMTHTPDSSISSSQLPLPLIQQDNTTDAVFK